MYRRSPTVRWIVRGPLAGATSQTHPVVRLKSRNDARRDRADHESIKKSLTILLPSSLLLIVAVDHAELRR
jgi:hypothetical protein